jgi:hypothetical protein
LGFFNKIKKADKFIVFNTARFSRGEYFNRNRIRASNKDGYLWLSIPIPKERRKLFLNELEVADLGDWPEKHLELISHYYSKTEFFDEHIEIFNNYYSSISELRTLDSVNWYLTEKLLQLWNVQTPIIYSSDMDDSVRDDKTERLIHLLEQAGATEYFSGAKGAEYMEIDKFKSHGIELVFQDFSYREHPQAFEPFVPNLSVVDLLFNAGKGGYDYF